MVKYSLEMKLKLINEYKEGENSISCIAKKCKINVAMLSRWISAYDSRGIAALKRSRKNKNILPSIS